jgi:hypothetical protein
MLFFWGHKHQDIGENMKSIVFGLVTVLMAFAGSANATSLKLDCHSASAQASGVLDVDSQNNATGTLSLTVTTANGTETSNTVFTGTYDVYPAGSFCYDSTITNLLVSAETASGKTVSIKSVRGFDCGPTAANGDWIYLNRDVSPATCTFSK